MQQKRIDEITEALYSNSASVLKEGILQYATIEELLILSTYSIERTAFRAAWALEHILVIDAQNMLHHINSILQVYSKSTNWSVLRSISKLILEYFSTAKNNELHEEDTELILNKTFDILENSACPIAVRCNCYDILYSFCSNQDWIINELKQRIQLDLAKNETPALRSRAKKILKNLERVSKS